jgi:hypothetical protein
VVALSARNLSENIKVFDDYADEQKFFKWQASEKSGYGRPAHIIKYNSTPMKQTVLMQRSGRKRLFDHNIFLRAVYAGKIIHNEYGNMNRLFEQASFIDIGSAILYGEGAPTVRDIFEDELLNKRLSSITATDINDTSNAKTMYVKIYFESKNNLPFKVLEIDKLLTTKNHIDNLIKGADSLSINGPVIFRAVNTGPDLFYSAEELQAHMQSLSESCAERNIMYLFSKYILFKPMNKKTFHIIGEIDPNVGIYHKSDSWLYIDWSRRKISKAFYPVKNYIQLTE